MVPQKLPTSTSFFKIIFIGGIDIAYSINSTKEVTSKST